MNSIIEAAAELQKVLQENRWPYCFIGGLAVLRWGRPRTTQDIDVSLYVRPGHEFEVIAKLLSRFSPRISDAAQFAEESRVVLAQSSTGIAFDITLAGFDFEKAIIDRGSMFEYAAGIELLTVSAEDLVTMKSFAGRDQDWLDVRGIIESNRDLDRNATLLRLKELADFKPEHGPVEKLEGLFAEIDPAP